MRTTPHMTQVIAPGASRTGGSGAQTSPTHTRRSMPTRPAVPPTGATSAYDAPWHHCLPHRHSTSRSSSARSRRATPRGAEDDLSIRHILGGDVRAVCRPRTPLRGSLRARRRRGKAGGDRRSSVSPRHRCMRPHASVHRAAPTAGRVGGSSVRARGGSPAPPPRPEGHSVPLRRARKPRGLNEYASPPNKDRPESFAAREVAWLLKVGGITAEHGKALGEGLDLDTLRASSTRFPRHRPDRVQRARAPGEEKNPAVRMPFTSSPPLRQAERSRRAPVGRTYLESAPHDGDHADGASEASRAPTTVDQSPYRRGPPGGASRKEAEPGHRQGVRHSSQRLCTQAIHGNDSVRKRVRST